MKINIEGFDELECDAVIGSLVREAEKDAVNTQVVIAGQTKPVFLLNGIGRMIINLADDLDMKPYELVVLVAERVAAQLQDERMDKKFKEMMEGMKEKE